MILDIFETFFPKEYYYDEEKGKEGNKERIAFIKNKLSEVVNAIKSTKQEVVT